MDLSGRCSSFMMFCNVGNNNEPPWEWSIPTIYGDDWGMAYYCYTHISKNQNELTLRLRHVVQLLPQSIPRPGSVAGEDKIPSGFWHVLHQWLLVLCCYLVLRCFQREPRVLVGSQPELLLLLHISFFSLQYDIIISYLI